MALFPHIVPDSATAIAILLRLGVVLPYTALAAVVLLQVRTSMAAILLSGACVATACSAALGSSFLWSNTASGADLLNLIRAAAWFLFVVYLCRRVPAARQRSRILATLTSILGVSAGTSILLGVANWSIALPMIGLGLAIGQMLLLENLYRNATDETRWHVGLGCIALGMLAGYDLLTSANALLFESRSAVLDDGRWLVALLTSPLLGVAVARSREWSIDLHVSRSAAFHSATLLISGVFLLAMAVTGELVRNLGLPSGDKWGSLAELCLLLSGLLTIAVLLTSASARSGLGRLLVDHFFSHRFDYRREWLRCIGTLCADSDSGTGEAELTLSVRAIKVIADVVDSPAGMLLLRGPSEYAWRWASSWNMPVLNGPVTPGHPLWDTLAWASEAVVLDPGTTKAPPLDGLAPLWLAVPLRTAGHEDEPAFGCILTAPPRMLFQLDHEVFALLRVLGRETATYLANHRAARTIAQTHELREYGRRFAFVAHDIKNVSGQLSLLLSNAERHLDNPAFRSDMLTTIGASVARINRLLQRLDAVEKLDASPAFGVAERLRMLVLTTGPSLDAPILFEDCDEECQLELDAEAFDTAIGHLLTNAVQAARESISSTPVRLSLRHDRGMIIIEITDSGQGMTPEFVRDTLFEPFRTTKPNGSGIGAFQARELLGALGGELSVFSKPGVGTTMRVTFSDGVANKTVRRRIQVAV